MKRYIVSQFQNTLENFSSSQMHMSASDVKSAVYEYCERHHMEITPWTWEFDSEDDARAFIANQNVQTYWSRAYSFGYDLNVDAFELSVETLDEDGDVEDIDNIDVFFEGVEA